MVICPTATVHPMAKAAVDLTNGLLGSQTPQTTNTKMNPRKNSNPRAWNGVVFGDGVVAPRFSGTKSCQGGVEIRRGEWYIKRYVL